MYRHILNKTNKIYTSDSRILALSIIGLTTGLTTGIVKVNDKIKENNLKKKKKNN